ncbi:MAG: hypothetical protein JWO86_1871 [Myxococcaceae bacterium]|nr:hypothetical protein [Myxococcaceae bacterium]MEA2749756.1 hypothetical protein [Myxococcales bacterium]
MTATARQKIEGLTNSWYGFAVFGALLSLWHGGIGFFSLIGTAFSFCFTIFLTWFIGRRLLAKSTLTRLVLILFTGVISVMDTVGVAQMGLTFFRTFSFSALAYVGVLGVHLYMNARSFRVLTDKSVKMYFS